MAYEMVMPYHLHMPSYFLETFTEYPYITAIKLILNNAKTPNFTFLGVKLGVYFTIC